MEKDKVINDLLKRVSNLEFELEKEIKTREMAIEYIHKIKGFANTKELIFNFDSIEAILKGVDKDEN